jgi:hypothetical protein
MVAILVVATIAVFFVVDALVRRRAVAKQPVRAFAPAFVREALQKVWMGSPALQPADFAPRPDRFYDSGHTFVEMAPDGTVSVGIDRFMREAMADFRVVGLLKDGQAVQKGDAIAELRSDGRTAKILSPVDGIVQHYIAPMPDEGVEPPLYSIVPQNLKSHLNNMTLGQQAGAWLKDEITKLREFADSVLPQPALVGATSADGGTPEDPLTTRCDAHQFNMFKNSFGLM